MLKTSLIKLTSRAFNTVGRFPLPALCSLLFCTIALINLYNDYAIWLKEEYQFTLLKILFCGFFWFTALKLFAERQKWDSVKHYTLGLGAFAIIAALNVLHHSTTSFIYMGAGLFLLVFLSPFLRKTASTREFWEFNYRLCLQLAFTILTAIILFCGISLILFSLTYFFNFDYVKHIYVYLWLIVATLFAPILALTFMPQPHDKLSRNYPKFFETLLSYIIIPLIFTFTAILYIYIAKILWFWELPKGGVANIITIFGGAGMLVYFISYPLHNSNGIIGIFHRNFFKIMLMPIVLLVVAIGYRIKQYGITEERYAILVCLAWLILSSFFAFTLPVTRTARLICLSLISLLLLSSYGPWSATNVSLTSQLYRLESALIKNGILVDGHITAKKRDLTDKEIQNITSMLMYIMESQAVDRMKPWFSGMPDAEVNKKNSYYDIELILVDLGIKPAKQQASSQGN